eukprot:29081-Pelagococcus_subviridis.AAC.17
MAGIVARHILASTASTPRRVALVGRRVAAFPRATPAPRSPATTTTTRRVRVSSRPSTTTRASSSDADAANPLTELITGKNESNAVTVWSKSWCPFCTQVKQLLEKEGASYLAIELDKFHEAEEIQASLAATTGQRTVPNVFVGGKHVGGCDDTMALHRSGELRKMIEAAGGFK